MHWLIPLAQRDLLERALKINEQEYGVKLRAGNLSGSNGPSTNDAGDLQGGSHVCGWTINFPAHC